MKPDVVILGGGAIGVASALELAKSGASVTILERGSSVGSGCSAGSAGLICPSHAESLASPASIRNGLVWMTQRTGPVHVRLRPAIAPWLARLIWTSRQGADTRTRLLRELSLASLALHAELVDSGLNTTFERRGILYVYETERAYQDVVGKAIQGVAELHCRTVTPKEIHELEPALSGTLAGGIYCEREAHLDSSGFVTALGEAAAARGVTIRNNAEIIGFQVGAGRVQTVETTAGAVHPGTVVLAAGVWSRMLARKLGLYLPVEAAKGYHADVGVTGIGPRLPVYMQEARVTVTPLSDRLRISGTLDLSGVDESVDLVRVRALIAAARHNISSLAETPRSIWRGFRPVAPDGLPIMGRPARYENLIVATGHGMMGVALAPITGRLVADLVAGAEPVHDIVPFHPDRFRAWLQPGRDRWTSHVRQRSTSSASYTAAGIE